MNTVILSLSIFSLFFVLMTLLVRRYIKSTEVLLPLGTLSEREDARAQRMMLPITLFITSALALLGAAATVVYYLGKETGDATRSDFSIFVAFPLLFGAMGGMLAVFTFNEGRKVSQVVRQNWKEERFAKVIQMTLKTATGLQLGLSLYILCFILQ